MGAELVIGQEYLIRAPGVAVLAVYAGLGDVGDDRELPRFYPVRWLRGAPADPCWPVYAGPRATWRAVAAFAGDSGA